MDSVRAECLPQDARDLLAWAFDTLTVGGLMPMNAAEVRLDDPVEHILEGGDGFKRHGGSVSECHSYFTHLNDLDWAVIICDDCDGDIGRGRALIELADIQRDPDGT